MTGCVSETGETRALVTSEMELGVNLDHSTPVFLVIVSYMGNAAGKVSPMFGVLFGLL